MGFTAAQLRGIAGLKQWQAAKAMGISRPTYTRLERDPTLMRPERMRVFLELYEARHLGGNSFALLQATEPTPTAKEGITYA